MTYDCCVTALTVPKLLCVRRAPASCDPLYHRVRRCTRYPLSHRLRGPGHGTDISPHCGAWLCVPCGEKLSTGSEIDGGVPRLGRSTVAVQFRFQRRNDL